jgi:hypothetical protein
LKKDFDLLQTVKGFSGVGWDEASHMVTAEATVWERLISTASAIVNNASGVKIYFFGFIAAGVTVFCCVSPELRLC